MKPKILMILLLTLTPFFTLFAGASGKIIGTVTDTNTGEPLPGANVYLEGTAIGAASNLKGEYSISPVPPGSYTVSVTFIGYKSKKIPIQIETGQTLELNIKLEFDIVKGQTVVITAQAEGQVAAINQQLRSNTISNVVSAERIQELPDANAAESVGRLPGISIKRSGGEGQKIIIRGLAPTYNVITIGGEKIPATDLDDRSVDLNMISPEILAGIEVIKALTPDKDADAFGGIVDFKLANAPEGGFKYNFKFKNGYNAQRNEFGQYKGSLTMSNRYNDEKFGIMVTGNIERAQRGSDQFNASYIIIREKREDEEFAPITTDEVKLAYSDEIRKRIGYSILMDYKLPNGRIMLSNFISRLDKNELINYEKWDNEANVHEIRLRERHSQIDVLSNALSGLHHIFAGELDWRISRTASLNRQPFDSRIRSRELSAFDFSKLPYSFGPDELIAAANNDYDEMFLYEGNFYTEKSLESDKTAQLNFKLPFTLTTKVSGYVKFGGKHIEKIKERDRGERSSRLDYTALNRHEIFERHHPRYGQPGFEYIWDETGWPSMMNYLDPSSDVENFMNGRYRFGPVMSRNDLNYFLNSYLLDSLYITSSLADLDDYEATESVTAGYIMAELNFGRAFMFLPGARYEYTRDKMTGRKGTVPSLHIEPELNSPFVSDTSATVAYGRWFPMIHFRVRPTNWFDVRLAYTKTFSRPKFSQMLPKKKVYESEKTVEFGRPDLKPQISNNYDVFLSFYSNNIGLFTIGGFYKEIKDLIFSREGHFILDAEAEGYTPDLQAHKLSQPENNSFPTKVRGLELEWQTNFHWLPSPFDGIVLNANYSHIWSNTNYPRSFVLREQIPVFPFLKTSVIDTFRTGKMLDQSDDIANIALGYDKGKFSARLSLLYQGRTLSLVGERPELDGYTADLLRLDLSVKYRLTKYLDFYFNWNNITDEPDESYQSQIKYLTAAEYYGWTMDAGVGLNF
ncbi:MAG: TonB-dependent receptor [Calditrichaeota bacterium]|nr:TonB-dependent receptor [Calditrichota bacterium]